jgi:hypothetical protein
MYLLEQPPFQARVDASKAAVEQLEAQHRNAQIKLNRAQGLLRTGAYACDNRHPVYCLNSANELVNLRDPLALGAYYADRRGRGLSTGLVARVCQPSTLPMLIWPEASSAQNNMAAASTKGSRVCVLILRLNFSRKMAIARRELGSSVDGRIFDDCGNPMSPSHSRKCPARRRENRRHRGTGGPQQAPHQH